MGKGKGAKVAATQIFGWGISTGLKLWQAVKPVWDTLHSAWEVVKPIWDKVEAVYETLKTYVVDVYIDWIKPVWDRVEVVWSKLNDVVDWIDGVYNATIGKIEHVYDTLFGRFEELAEKFRLGAEKTTRLIAVFSEDLAKKIYDTAEMIEASTIGRIREIRDSITHQVDVVYNELRDRINDFYYAVKDIIDPVRRVVFEVKDFLEISFEKPDLLRRETIVKTADTYGDRFSRSASATDLTYKRPKAPPPVPPGEMVTILDSFVEEMDKEETGLWADVHEWLIRQTEQLDAGQDPIEFIQDAELLDEVERKEYEAQQLYPDDPEIAEYIVDVPAWAQRYDVADEYRQARMHWKELVVIHHNTHDIYDFITHFERKPGQYDGLKEMIRALVAAFAGDWDKTDDYIKTQSEGW